MVDLPSRVTDSHRRTADSASESLHEFEEHDAIGSDVGGLEVMFKEGERNVTAYEDLRVEALVAIRAVPRSDRQPGERFRVEAGEPVW